MKTPSSHNMDSVYALLATTAQPPVAEQTCPSDEELAALMAGELEAAERQRILARLRACPDSYALWQMAEDCMQTLQVTEDTAAATTRSTESHHTVQQPSQKWPWLTTVRDWLSFPAPQLVWAMPIVLLLITVPVFWLLWDSELSLPQQLDNSYQQLARYEGVSASAALLNFNAASNTGAEVTFSFAPEQVPTVEQQAFTAGLQDGQAQLLQRVGLERADWATPEAHDYYALGRWLVLVWAVAHSAETQPAGFWQAQQTLLTELQRRLAENAELSRALQPVGEILAELPNAEQPVLRDRLAREVQFVMHTGY